MAGPAHRRRWIALAAVGGVVAAVVVAGVVLLVTQDVSPLKDLVERQVLEQTGRRLTIGGEFGLSVSFSPAIRATDVTLENASWASSPAMLTLAEVEAKVALLPMLFGDIEVERLVLRNGVLALERDAEGRQNWQFEATQPGAPAAAPGTAPGGPENGTAQEPGDQAARPQDAAALPAIGSVELDGVRLTYRDATAGTAHTIVLEEARGGQEKPGEPFVIAARGAIDGAPVELEGELGPGLRNAPVKLDGIIAGAKLKVEGVIAEVSTFDGLGLDLALEGRSLADLAPLLGDGVPALGPYALAGKLTGGAADGNFALDGMTLSLGSTSATGRIGVRLSGERPAFDAELSVATLDLDAFSGAGGGAQLTDPERSGEPDAGTTTEQTDTPKKEREGASRGSGKLVFSDDPLPVDGLRGADGTAKVAIARVIAGKTELEEIELNIVLEHGILRIDPFKGVLAKGPVAGSLSLDAAAEQPTLMLDAALTDADFGALTESEKTSDFVGGKLDARIDAMGRGRSLHAIASSLNGVVSVNLTEGRKLPAWLEYALGRDLLGALAFWSEGEAPRLNCFVARARFKDGMGRFDDLLADTPQATVAGTGTLDLKTETLDLTLVPRPKDASLLSLAFPVEVQGPLRQPDWSIDREAAALDVAKSVAGDALLGPLGLLLPLVEEGTGEEDPCGAALARASQGANAPAVAPAPKEGEEKAPTAPLEDLLEKGLKSIEDLF